MSFDIFFTMKRVPLQQKDQMDKLIDAVSPPKGESNYIEWSVNEKGELDLFEEVKID